MSARKIVSAINRTKHPLSAGELREFGARAPAGATRIEVVETKHVDVVRHELQLVYTTSRGRFLYCKAAGGSFSDVLEQLKSCTNQAAKIDPRAKAKAEDPLKGQF